MTALVFVYGTLKDGFPNYTVNKGELFGRYLTEQAYPLLLVGDRFTPWLVDSPGQGERVSGEVYEVTPEQLAAMDRLERIDQPDGYQRKIIRVVPDQDSTAAMTVFAYLKAPGLLSDQDVQSELLANYSSEHAALYRPRST